MAEAPNKYPQCPKGHSFSDNAEAFRVRPMGQNDQQLIDGWVMVYCRACGHIYQLVPPTATILSKQGL